MGDRSGLLALASILIALATASPPLGAQKTPADAPPPAVQAPNVPPTPGSEGAGSPSMTVLDTQEVQGILGREVRGAEDENMGRIVDVIVDVEGRTRATDAAGVAPFFAVTRIVVGARRPGRQRGMAHPLRVARVERAGIVIVDQRRGFPNAGAKAVTPTEAITRITVVTRETRGTRNVGAARGSTKILCTRLTIVAADGTQCLVNRLRI